jgi:hypothetical protein
MRDRLRCVPVAVLCLGAALTCCQSSWAQTAAPPRPIEIEPHTEAPAPPVKVQLKTVPLQTVAPPTAEELSHIVAYYVAATHTLHVYNADHFVQGIGRGKFLATWSKGVSKATVRDADGSAIEAGVISEDLIKDVPSDPKVGDIKYVELEQTASHQEQKGSCYKTGGSGGKDIGSRLVLRQYTNLVPDGKESGTETWSEAGRYYHYDLTDCSAGYSDSSNGSNTWTLTVGPWPNP